MTSSRLKEILLKLPELNLPERSELVGWAQMVEVTSVEPSSVGELLELGWLNPVKTQNDEYLFKVKDVYRIRKLMRICSDLDVSLMGGSIIVDLLERIERLENELEETRRLV